MHGWQSLSISAFNGPNHLHTAPSAKIQSACYLSTFTRHAGPHAPYVCHECAYPNISISRYIIPDKCGCTEHATLHPDSAVLQKSHSLYSCFLPCSPSLSDKKNCRKPGSLHRPFWKKQKHFFEIFIRFLPLAHSLPLAFTIYSHRN